MVTLTISNSMSRIEGLTATQFSRLRKVLSYQDNPQAAYFSVGYNRLKYLLDKKGYFPTGLYTYVVEWTAHESIGVNYKDIRVVPTISAHFNLNLKQSPYTWQAEAMTSAINHLRGGIVATTGSGKTVLMALIAARLCVRTLIVVPSLEIQKQVQEAMKAIFGPTDESKLAIVNIDSPRLASMKDYDCLIIDECHHAAAKTYQKLNKTAWTNIFYRYFLSATFFRNQQNEQLLFESIAGQVIYELPYLKARVLGIVVPVEAYYYDVPLSFPDCYTWNEVYEALIVSHEERNQMIAMLLMQLQDGNASTLCLVKEIRHGQTLSDLTGIPFVNGQDEESRHLIQKFNNKEITCLIGTTGILGEGVDTKPCEYIIVAGLGKAKSAFMQQVGRAVRTFPDKESAKIILFRDKSHKFSLRHFNIQAKVMKEVYGVKPIKLDQEEK
jgi:superfamily II DNA or RNA helicase